MLKEVGVNCGMYQLQVVKTHPIGDNGRCIYLQKPDGWSHHAGQYLTLELEIEGKLYRRSYSIFTPPESETLGIAVQAVANGQVSRWLINHLQYGQFLRSTPAMGRFLVNDRQTPAIFIAAGSGITPIYALIKQLLLTGNNNLRLLYAVKSKELAWFATELEELSKKSAGRFSIQWLESRPITGSPRRLSNYFLEQWLQQVEYAKEAHYYLCGPFAFMRTARFTLGFIGVSTNRIFQEQFASEGQRYFSGNSVAASAVEANCSLKTATEVFQWHNSAKNSLLKGAKEHGVSLPYSCENGFCGSCVIRLKEGQVVHRINEVLTEKELEQGWILSCTAYATSANIELEL